MLYRFLTDSRGFSTKILVGKLIREVKKEGLNVGSSSISLSLRSAFGSENKLKIGPMPKTPNFRINPVSLISRKD